MPEPTPGAKTSNVKPTTVLYSIIALVGITAATVIGLAIGAKSDSTPFVTSIVALVVPVIGVLLTLVKVEQVHEVVNSSADQQRRTNEDLAAENDRLKRRLGDDPKVDRRNPSAKKAAARKR